MSVSSAYVSLGLLIVIMALFSKETPTQETINFFSETFTTTNILISFGVIGICRRLDKMIKKLEGSCEQRKENRTD